MATKQVDMGWVNLEAEEAVELTAEEQAELDEQDAVRELKQVWAAAFVNAGSDNFSNTELRDKLWTIGSDLHYSTLSFRQRSWVNS